MVNHVRVEFRGWPGEHEDIVPFARLDLSERPFADFFRRNNVNCDLDVILLAPVAGQHICKPPVKFRKEVRPFGDLERFLARRGMLGKKKEWTKGGCGR